MSVILSITICSSLSLGKILCSRVALLRKTPACRTMAALENKLAAVEDVDIDSNGKWVALSVYLWQHNAHSDWMQHDAAWFLYAALWLVNFMIGYEARFRYVGKVLHQGSSTRDTF